MKWERQKNELSQIRDRKTKTDDWLHLPAVNEDNAITSRYCNDDSDTKQCLGYENYASQNENWKNKEGKKGEWKVNKYFHYL